jgi:CheY-like chemotaxis protein
MRESAKLERTLIAFGTKIRIDRFWTSLPHKKVRLLKKLEDLHVLVVEDEAIIAMLIEDTILDIGCGSVEVAPSIDRALELISIRKPDFAILDLNLHGNRSYPVADALQVEGRPFVFLSGYGAKGLDGDYKDAPVLQKPFQQVDLENALKRAVLLIEAAAS